MSKELLNELYPSEPLPSLTHSVTPRFQLLNVRCGKDSQPALSRVLSLSLSCVHMTKWFLLFSIAQCFFTRIRSLSAPLPWRLQGPLLAGPEYMSSKVSVQPLRRAFSYWLQLHGYDLCILDYFHPRSVISNLAGILATPPMNNAWVFQISTMPPFHTILTRALAATALTCAFRLSLDITTAMLLFPYTTVGSHPWETEFLPALFCRVMHEAVNQVYCLMMHSPPTIQKLEVLSITVFPVLYISCPN